MGPRSQSSHKTLKAPNLSDRGLVERLFRFLKTVNHMSDQVLAITVSGKPGQWAVTVRRRELEPDESGTLHAACPGEPSLWFTADATRLLASLSEADRGALSQQIGSAESSIRETGGDAITVTVYDGMRITSIPNGSPVRVWSYDPGDQY